MKQTQRLSGGEFVVGPTSVTRTGTWQLRRWCPAAQTHQDKDDVLCNWTNCGGRYQTHRLRLRRMLICSVSDCQQGYFNQSDFDVHECGSAY